MANGEVTVELARIDERVSDLEEWRDKQNDLLAKIQEELQNLRLDWGRRPTWAVTVLISVMSSACVGMALYIITNK